MPIPTDWVESEQGYALYLVCGPNSDQWRRNVKGAIYALTRGRNYDFDTGIFKDIEQLANDLDDSFMSICMNELLGKFDDLIKTQRMIVAALMGQSINFETEGLPDAINYSNGIRQAILSITGALGDDMTLQELKDLIDSIDLSGTDFIDTLTDIAQILAFLFLVFGPDERVVVALGWWDKMTLKRWQHNELTIAAHQATSLRGIMRALAPFKEESEEEETNLWETIGKIPWLARAVVAIAEPTPTGEVALIATTLGGVVNTIFQTLREAWNIWWNKWINLVEEPEPMDSVTTALGVIANRIATREDVAENPEVSITNRLDVIAENLEELDTSALVPAIELISTILGSLATMPEGTNWQDLITQITEKMGETMPIINVSCGSCGSSGGCGCGGGGGSMGGSTPGVSGPGDKPPIEVVSGSYPPSFPSQPVYDTYKCKAANVLVLNLAETIAQIGQLENINLSQYETRTQAGIQLGLSVTAIIYTGGLLAPFADYLVEKVIDYLWPYPNEDSSALAIFEGVRLELLVDRQDAVCEFYNAEDTGEARDAMTERLTGYINDTAYPSDTKQLAIDLCTGILSNQFLNRLFQKDAAINVYSDASAIDCSLCSEPGLLAQTSMSSPYNVLIKGDTINIPGDETGWYNNPTPLIIEFTPEVNTSFVQVTLEYQNSAPEGFVTGSVSMANWGEINLLSDGDGEFEEFDVTLPCVMAEGVQTSLHINPSTVHGQVIRKVEVRSVEEP